MEVTDFFYIGKGNITENLIREFLLSINKNYIYYGHRCTKQNDNDKCHIQYYDIDSQVRKIVYGNEGNNVQDKVHLTVVNISEIESFIRDKKLDKILNA